MYDNYKYLNNKIPYILKATETNQMFIRGIADVFDLIDSYLDILENYWLIDKAKGEFLDDLGMLVEENRNNDVDNNYRKRIKLKFQTLDIVPTLDNILNLIKNFTGLFPEIREGWKVDGEPGRYDIDFIAEKNYNFALIDVINLENIIGGGIKINTRKCLENYTEAYYSGDINSGDLFFPLFFEKNADCDFNFNDIAYAKDISSSDTLYLSDDLINFERRKQNVEEIY